MYQLRLLLLVLAGGLVTLPAFSGELPEWAKDQQHYARILNPIAAKVMNWLDKEQISTGKSISLKDASLNKTGENQFDFILEKQLSGAEPSTLITTFVFVINEGALPHLTATNSRVVDVPAQITSQAPLLASSQSLNSDDQNMDRLIYRSREVAYWWLAHLDGVAHARDQAAISNWINQVSIQSTANQPTVAGVEGNGGHLLRTLTIKREEQSSQFELRLMIDWKGKLANGKPGLARLEHILTGQILDDGSLMIERIVENALLPDLQPWTNILC